MQKEVITEDKNHEFYVPQKLKDLYYAKDFGPYARKEDGKLGLGPKTLEQFKKQMSKQKKKDQEIQV